MLNTNDYLPGKYQTKRSASPMQKPIANDKPTLVNTRPPVPSPIKETKKATPPSPPPAVKPVSRPKKKNNIIVSLAVIILLGAGALASFFLVKQNQDLRQQASVDVPYQGVGDISIAPPSITTTLTATPSVAGGGGGAGDATNNLDYGLSSAIVGCDSGWYECNVGCCGLGDNSGQRYSPILGNDYTWDSSIDTTDLALGGVNVDEVVEMELAVRGLEVDEDGTVTERENGAVVVNTPTPSILPADLNAQMNAVAEGCDDGWYQCNVGCCGIGGTDNEGMRYSPIVDDYMKYGGGGGPGETSEHYTWYSNEDLSDEPVIQAAIVLELGANELFVDSTGTVRNTVVQYTPDPITGDCPGEYVAVDGFCVHPSCQDRDGDGLWVCGYYGDDDPCTTDSLGGDWCTDPDGNPVVCGALGLIRCQCSPGAASSFDDPDHGYWVIGKADYCWELCEEAAIDCDDCDDPGPEPDPDPLACGQINCVNDDDCSGGLVCLSTNDGQICADPAYTNACLANPSETNCCTESPLMCRRIDILDSQNNILSGDADQNFVPGETELKFKCAASDNEKVDHFEFRILVPSTDSINFRHPITLAEDPLSKGVSESYLIETSGDYRVQCRICESADKCQTWEEDWWDAIDHN